MVHGMSRKTVSESLLLYAIKKFGITAADRVKLNSIATAAKINLNATAPPTVNDDESQGYSEGSTWSALGVTYLCSSATKGSAVWVATTEISYFDTWALLVAAISVAGSNYVNKYAIVSNANGAPDSGQTYTAPGTVSNPIVDGGQAAYQIKAQGTNYSVVCQSRSGVGIVIVTVLTSGATLPTTIAGAGYYIPIGIPSGGLPAGISLNDIVYFNGANWATYQRYSAAGATVVVGQVQATQVTWRKFMGSWMSTAEDFVTDGNEYLTSKRWDGKPVYRKCTQGTTGTIHADKVNTGMVVPRTGRILRVEGTIQRGTGTIWLISSQGTQPATFNFGVSSEGNVVYGVNADSGGNYDPAYNNTPYTVWCEYTKS